jgi:DNA-binding transcriptional ArsR family regulator
MASYHPSLSDVSLSDVLAALGDPVRLNIVKCLAGGGEHPCGAFHPEIARSTLSRHFRVLREAGLIWVRPQGTSYMNSLRRDDIEKRFPGLLDAVLKLSNE